MIKPLFYKLNDEKRRKLEADLYQIFSEKDLITVSVKDIVAVTGISRGSFYTYFDTPVDAYSYVFRKVLIGVHQQMMGANAFGSVRQFIESMDKNPDRDFLKNYYTVNEMILEANGESQMITTGEENLHKWMVLVSIHELIRRYFLNPGDKGEILSRLSSLEEWEKENS